MPIDHGVAPNAAVAAANRALRAPAFPTSALRNVPAKALQRSFPHRVASLSLGQLGQDGDDLGQMTQPRGWRFLVHNGPNAAFAAVRVAATGGNDYELGELSEGGLVTGTEEAVRFAETQVDQLRDGRFEAVLLTVPELYIVVLWLQRLDAKGDFVLTIPYSQGAGAEPHTPQVMTAAAFLAQIRDLRNTVMARPKRERSRPRG